MKELGSLFDHFWDFHNIQNEIPREDSLRIKNSRLWNIDPMAPFFIDPEEIASTREEYRSLFTQRYGKVTLKQIYEKLSEKRVPAMSEAMETAFVSCHTVLTTPPEAIANTWTAFPHILNREIPQFLDTFEKEASPSFVGKACLDDKCVNSALYLIEWRIENGI